MLRFAVYKEKKKWYKDIQLKMRISVSTVVNMEV